MGKPGIVANDRVDGREKLVKQIAAIQRTQTEE